MAKILILANKDITLYFFRQELIKKLIEDKNEVYVSFPNDEKTNPNKMQERLLTYLLK